MNFDAIIESAVEFSSHGIGAMLRDVFTILYDIFYPSNAEAATPVDLPK